MIFISVHTPGLVILSLLTSVSSLLCPDLNLPRKEIVFQNTGELVPDLWQGRIMTPGYNSQYALNYIAYVFLQELLGMNVTFYPYDEPQFIAKYEINGENFSYPKYYFEFIKNDDVDMEFEVWTSHEADVEALEKYYLPGSIISQTNGIYGEVGWFAPKYFIDEFPKAVLSFFLQNDNETRDLLIAGSNGSYPNTTNWIKYFSNTTNLPNPYRWDLANRTINNIQAPVIWGSVEDYFMSERSFAMSRNYDLSFVAVGSETKLNKMIIELYNAKAPFIANIYIPDDNFATLDTDGNVFEFEKITLPFNPGQSYESECFIEKKCQFPLEALKKTISPKLFERFPEMAQFYEIFNLNSFYVSYIISYYIGLRDLPITENEKWIKATCMWLNDTRVTELWNNSMWLIDVKRWECIPGCGILKDDNITYIGGTCDYLNPNNIEDGTCVCDYKELFGEKCDKSCPGLLPINDSLLFCNGNGICDITSFTCECNDGYVGKGCKEIFKIFIIPKSFIIFSVIIGSILISIIIFCIYWLLKNKNYQKVKILRVKLTFLFCIGLILLTLSNIIKILDVSNFSCICWFWVFNIGCILLTTPPLMKIYRINKIYNDGFIRNDLNITDNKLLIYIGFFVSIDIFLCSIYTLLHMKSGITNYTDLNKLEIIYTCNNVGIIYIVNNSTVIYYTMMIILNAYFSYKLKQIKNFSETLCIFFSSVFTLFSGILLVAFFSASDDIFFELIINACTIFIIVIQILCSYFFVKIYNFYKFPENRNKKADIDIEISISERDIELR
jgi:hypothetical protein